VEIQASWGQWEGANVNYTFDGYDWDSIDGWKEPGEMVAWNLEVVAPGEYEVTVSYGCAPSGMGGKFRIQAGDGASALVAEVRPTSNGEVFERFTLGTLKLPKGKTRLTVEAVEVKGSELMRLNRLWLRKISQ
jgi:arylsulfatase A